VTDKSWGLRWGDIDGRSFDDATGDIDGYDIKQWIDDIDGR